jgi:hypothetical protein
LKGVKKLWLVKLVLRAWNDTVVRVFEVEAPGPRRASGEARSRAQAAGYRVVRMVTVVPMSRDNGAAAHAGPVKNG